MKKLYVFIVALLSSAQSTFMKASVDSFIIYSAIPSIFIELQSRKLSFDSCILLWFFWNWKKIGSWLRSYRKIVIYFIRTHIFFPTLRTLSVVLSRSRCTDLGFVCRREIVFSSRLRTSFLIRERKKGEKRWRKSGGYWQRCNGRKGWSMQRYQKGPWRHSDDSFGAWSLANVKMRSVRVVKKKKKKKRRKIRS